MRSAHARARWSLWRAAPSIWAWGRGIGSCGVASGLYGIAPATAQSEADADRFLLRPVVDGDPDNPPRFRRPAVGTQSSTRSRLRAAPSFSYRPAFGAGLTGFDSTNARRQKGKGAAKAKSARPTTTPSPEASAQDTEAPPRPLAAPAPTVSSANTVRQYRAQRGLGPLAIDAFDLSNPPPVPAPLHRRL